MRWSAKPSPISCLMKDEAAEDEDETVMKESFEIKLFHEFHHCSAVGRVKAEDKHECTERQLRFIPIIRIDGRRLHRPRRSGCRELQTFLQQLCAWTARLCP